MINYDMINLPFNYSSIKDDFKLCYQNERTYCGDWDSPGYWAVVQGSNILVVQNEGTAQPGFSLPEGVLRMWLKSDMLPVVIGEWKGKPLRAITISSSITPEYPFIAEAFNAASERLNIQTLSLGGIARQILHWLRQSRHCSRCGGTTGPIFGTWGRSCPQCGAEHYPHIHPCAIVLVKRGNQLLLTRKAEWVPGRYSLIAGFVDFGESLEECAIREAMEETSISIKNVRYVGSQSWPFPAQMMAGFIADYDSGELRVDYNELEDARWFEINNLPALPPSRSIARLIIERTIAGCFN
ncbi:MAG TPA: NAD(+) diphosphatase [Deltaproteobacteria bacterium]|nr:NAD(+) diphosphatase [Deltaproteobacteria bacterium]HQB39884.1 NAD(+) diphosphatase [Deltaproteobacteria bacterium]